MERQCKICKTVKPYKDFKRDNTCDHGIRHICLDCNRRIQNAYYHNTKTLPLFKKARRESLKKHDLKRKYGITPKQHEALFSKQNGLCAICGSDGNGKALHIDHCHSTGKVGGMLCVTCNIGLGSFKDSPLLLALAIQYLSKHRT
jgi:Recombination endonuclease VII